MHGNCSDVDIWILKELGQLGIPTPKLKKIRIQIQKKNEKGKASGMFGVCLAKLIPSDEILKQPCSLVPPFLEKMTNFLSEHLTHNCIFRKNGNKDRMRQLQERLEMGHDLLTDVCVEDVAGILKSWFRDLPVSLVPDEFHDLFISCHSVCEKSSSSKALLLACSLLPTEHLSTLKYIVEFLASVAKHSDVNKMSSQSLAIVFAPNFMPATNKRRPDKSISIEAMKEKQELAQNVVQWLIEHWEEVKKTPESVEFLAQLSTQPSNKSSRKKRTKRRKSMCDIVGVKIKKLVAPQSDDKQADRPRNSSVLKHKTECKSAHPEVPLKRSKKHMTDASVEDPTDKKLNNENETESIVKRTPFPELEKLNQPKEDCIVSTEVQIKDAVETSQVPGEQQEDTNKEGTFFSSNDKNLVTTIFVQPSVVSVDASALVTPTKANDENSDKPRSTLKRGRPNSVTSGLKDRRKVNLRGSTSLENLIIPFEQLEVSTRRRSRSASSLYKSFEDHSQQISTSPSNNGGAITTIFVNGSERKFPLFNVSQDLACCKETSNNDLSTSVNRMLDFFNLEEDCPLALSSSSSLSNAYCGIDSIEDSPVSARYTEPLAKPLGISPVLECNIQLGDENKSKDPDTLSVGTPNVSRNPFQDITNDSDIPTLNSSIGDNSFFNTCEKSINNLSYPSTTQIPLNDHFCTPSPIVCKISRKTNAKSTITASSTPANEISKISWHSATSFDFDKSADDKLAEPKRESIIKLKETNAGKVLANIKLYNEKVSHNPEKTLESPASRKNVFERNGLATKSVRERSKQLFEQQGFKVPGVCPSSIKRISRKNKVTKSFSVPETTSVDTPCLETIAKVLKEPFQEVSKNYPLSVFSNQSTANSSSKETDLTNTKHVEKKMLF